MSLTKDRYMALLGDAVRDGLISQGFCGRMVLVYEAEPGAVSTVRNVSQETMRSMLRAATELQPENESSIDMDEGNA